MSDLPPASRIRAQGTLGPPDSRYKWTALSNTSLGMFLALLDSSILLISLPAIFRGIHVDPLNPANADLLLWSLMGYLLVTAVLVVTFGRLGDIYGRVRMYNLGFLIFTLASIFLALLPSVGRAGAIELIAARMVQGAGGAFLMANSPAILTDAFPSNQRGMAMGLNMISGLAGSFLGLVVGGVLAGINWHLVFWVNVPFGALGTFWAYFKLKETGLRSPARIDWWGNLTFAAGLIMVLMAITYALQPFRQPRYGLDPAAGAGTSSGGSRTAGHLHLDGNPGAPAARGPSSVPHPGLHRRKHRRLLGRCESRGATVHAHHLAAGHLATFARLQLRTHAAVGRHLHAAPHRRHPGRRAGIGLAL